MKKWTTPNPEMNFYDIGNEPYFTVYEPDGREEQIQGEPVKCDRTIARVYGPDCKELAAQMALIREYVAAHAKLVEMVRKQTEFIVGKFPNSILATAGKQLLKDCEEQIPSGTN